MIDYHIPEYLLGLSQAFGGSVCFWKIWLYVGMLIFAFLFGISLKHEGFTRIALVGLAILLGGPLVWAFAIAIGFLVLCYFILCMAAGRNFSI